MLYICDTIKYIVEAIEVYTKYFRLYTCPLKIWWFGCCWPCELDPSLGQRQVAPHDPSCEQQQRIGRIWPVQEVVMTAMIKSVDGGDDGAENSQTWGGGKDNIS